MTDASTIGLATAFVAGIVSFVSPCVLPLVPAYVSYIGGHYAHESHRANQHGRLQALILSGFFVLGFGTVFVALGASATAIGRIFLQYRYQANIIGGIVVIGFGLFMLGLMRHVSWLHRDVRLHPRLTGGHPASAFAVGAAFGFGWTPCIGPILGAILTISAVQGSVQGSISLLTAYALGLGVPFLVSAVFLRELLGRLRVLRRIGQPLQVAAGVILVVFGVTMVTGDLTALSLWFMEMFPALARLG